MSNLPNRAPVAAPRLARFAVVGEIVSDRVARYRDAVGRRAFRASEWAEVRGWTVVAPEAPARLPYRWRLAQVRAWLTLARVADRAYSRLTGEPAWFGPAPWSAEAPRWPWSADAWAPVGEHFDGAEARLAQ